MYSSIFFNFTLCIKHTLYTGKSNPKVRFSIPVDLSMSKLHKTLNPKYIYTYISDSKLTTVILTFNKENSQNVIYFQ